MSENTSARHIIAPVLIALLICGMFLLQIYLEDMFTRYALISYQYLPLYIIKGVFCLAWAVGARIAIAVSRKNTYHGKIGVMVPAIVLFVVLAAVAVIDYIFFTKRLFLNQAFCVIALSSLLCCVMRKK